MIKRILVRVVAVVVAPAVRGAALLVGAAVGAALLFRGDAEEQLEKTLVLDSYGRPFEVDLGGYVTIADRASDVGSFFSSLDEQYGAARMQTGLGNSFVDFRYSTFGTETFEFDRYSALAGDVVWDDQQNTDVSFSLAGGDVDGLNYRISHNTNPQHSVRFSCRRRFTWGHESGGVFVWRDFCITCFRFFKPCKFSCDCLSPSG